MPRGRMQHNAALPRGKSCSAYATKLIPSTLKRILSTIFQFTKTVEQETRMHHMPCQKLCLTTVDGKYRRGKPLMRLTLCQSNFIPCSILQHAAVCRNHAKAALHLHPHYFMQLPHNKASFCCIFLCGIVLTDLILCEFPLKYQQSTDSV